MTTEFQENAIGVRLKLIFVDEKGVALDLSSAQAIEIRLSTPWGGSKTFAATIVNPPGTDGVAELFTLDKMLVPSGDWDIQGFVTFSGGDDLPTKAVAFVVKPNITEP